MQYFIHYLECGKFTIFWYSEFKLRCTRHFISWTAYWQCVYSSICLQWALRKSYSICSSCHKQNYQIFVLKVQFWKCFKLPIYLTLQATEDNFADYEANPAACRLHQKKVQTICLDTWHFMHEIGADPYGLMVTVFNNTTTCKSVSPTLTHTRPLFFFYSCGWWSNLFFGVSSCLQPQHMSRGKQTRRNTTMISHQKLSQPHSNKRRNKPGICYNFAAAIFK